MPKSVLILLFLFGFILVISASRKGFLPTNGDEMIQHPFMPNLLIRRRYIRSFWKDSGTGVMADCCLACVRSCICCYANVKK